MAKMTSRERVVAALSHQEPDLVPIDFGSGMSTSLVVEAYEKLKAELGISGETQVLNKLFRVARLDEAAMLRLNSDCRPIQAKGPTHWAPPPTEPGTYVDVWGVKRRQVFYGEGAYYWELVANPLAEASIEDLDRYPWPDPLDPGFTEGLAEDAKRLHEATDFAIVGDSGFKSLWELGWALRGFERLLMDVALNPDFVHALMGKLLDINMAATGRFLDTVGKYLQVFRTGDDLATQKGLLMSRAAYQNILKPHYKKFFDSIKSKTDAKLFYHSCGNVTDVLDDLIEIGVDAINPVQVSALGDTAALKSRFGPKVSFWGGIDTQHALPHGSVQDVEAEVRLRIRDLGPGGGFVLGPVHNIQPDVPPENILMMADAARKFGAYPLVA